MIPAPLKIDLDKLQRVVATATGCITQGAVDHFMLRAVTRADYLEDDVLMVALTDGGSESCYAVELVDAERNDPLAVKVQGVRFSEGILSSLGGDAVAGVVEESRSRRRLTALAGVSG